MAIPSFLKSPYFLGSVGTAGAIVAGLWFFNEKKEEERIPEKIFLNLPPVVEFKENKCFLESFSKAWPQKNVELGGGKAATKLDMAHAKKKIAFPGLGSNPNVVGCMGLNLSHGLNNSLWNFGLGLTLKNENAGVALYADGAGRNASPSESRYGQILRYNLFLLKKESRDWSIKAGYSWRDNEITGNDLKLYFMDILGSNLIDAQANNKLGGLADSGSWKGVSNSSVGVDRLGKLELKGTKDGRALVLGRKGSFREIKNDFYLSRVYDVDKQEWFEDKDLKFDLGEVLDTWFAPFMNSKIAWTGSNTGCSWDLESEAGCSNSLLETKK